LEALLREASDFYAAALYPEMDRPPVERVRAFVNDVAPGRWATGGVLVSNGAAPAPFFTCLSLRGRPALQLQDMMRGLTELTSRHLGCAADLVRGQLIEIHPEHWFIGGACANVARGDEIRARNGE